MVLEGSEGGLHPNFLKTFSKPSKTLSIYFASKSTTTLPDLGWLWQVRI